MRRQAPEETTLDLVAEGGASIVSFNMSEDDLEHIMRQSYTMTSSDGGLVPMGDGKPHPRSYGAHARKLERYVRNRKVVSLESAVRSMTSLPATVFGLTNRGVIQTGAWADLAIFEPGDIHETATYTDPHQVAQGMHAVIVNGIVVIENGKFTSAAPGRVLSKN
jgi:N-acyl-D-aspartate/D-glutamate deacylase